MGAGEEIDLTGLDKQIIETQRHIEELNKSVGKFGNSLTSLEHKELGQKLHALSGSVNDLFSAIANTKGIENSVGAIKSLTEAMEVLNKAMTATENASALFKTGFVQGEIGAASGMIQDLMNRLADGITKSSETMSKSSVSFVRNLQAEFNKIIKEAPPKIAKLDVFNAEQTLNDLDAVRAKSADLREYLRALGEEFKRVQSGSDTTIKNLPQEMGRAKKELQEAERTETALLESLNSSVVNQRNFNESLLQSTEYYARIKSFYDEIVSRMELMSRTGGDNKEIKKLENWKNALELLMKPYAEFISSAEKQTSAIDAATKALSTQVKYSKELANTNKELAEKRKYLSELEVSSKSTKTALDLDRQRMEVIEQLVEKYKQLKEMSERKNVKQDALQPMLESVTELEEKLKKLQEQLNAIFKANPYAQKAVNASVMGSFESVMDKKGNISQQIKGADENAINLLNTFHKLVLELGNATNLIAKMSQQSQRQAKIEQDKERRLAQSMQARSQLEQRLAELQKQVSKGSESAIQRYLKQNLSISRLRRSLDGIRYAQEQCNHATLEGRQQYEKLEFEARKLQKTLDQIQGKQSILNKMFVKMKLGVGQISTAFGVMGGIFGAVNFIKSLYKITSEFQLQQKALAAITQNAREANILFNQMSSLAIESPLKLMDLNKYSKQLAAFRIETNKIYDSLKMLGDISVGVGVDMDRLILAYGQVKAANYLRGQELRQFSEAGVNILGGLQQYYKETKNINMSINEIFDSVSKRKVLFEDVDAVLHKMTEDGGAFFNMQLTQSQTLYGQYQKLGDMFQIEMNKIGSSTSGMLLGLVKALQLLTQNLKGLLNILISIGVYTGMNKLIRSIQTGNLVSKQFVDTLRLASVQVKNLASKDFSKFIANLRSSKTEAVALRRVLTSLGVSAIAFAGSVIFSAIQNRIQKAKELRDELNELNKRFVDLQKIEKDFDSTNLYKDKMIALQNLVEKAKEYGTTLQAINKYITPQNINEVFAEASKELENYIQKVYDYRAALVTPNTTDLYSRWAKVGQDFTIAFNNAKSVYDDLLKNISSLSDEQKAKVKEIEEIENAIAKHDTATLEKFKVNSGNWKQEFVRRVYDAANYQKSLDDKWDEFLRRFDLKYRSASKLINEAYPEYTPDDKGINDNIEKYFGNLEKTYNKQLKQFEKDLKNARIDPVKVIWGDGKKSAEEQEQAIYDFYKQLLETFKDMPEFAKGMLPDFIADLGGYPLEHDFVWNVIMKYSEKEGDYMDEELQKYIKEVLSSDEDLKKSIGVEIVQTVIDKDGKVKETTENLKEQSEVLKEIYGEEGDILYTANEIALATLNTAGSEKEKHKAYEDATKLYREQRDAVKKALDGQLDQARVLKRIRILLKQNFNTLEDADKYIDSILKKGKIFGDYMLYPDVKEKGKTTGTKSMKSEYQSMIDFVRELNREFDTLRKNFNENDAGRWIGATNRILSSFEAKFGAMPTKFKKAFQNTLSSIDFTTKEGTVNAENIVKGLIDSAKDLTPKEKSELQRAWGEAVGQIKLEAELELKAREDERLKAQVQKMFDDYNLTIELDKLGVDADEVGKLFNIDTKDLLTLENKLESMKEKFVGRQMEKEYRQFMRKIVEINDKANLEMAKKYVKYLREEYNERAKIELEYMKQRAEVYALPFDENETSRILDNLQKETKKKLDEIDWKTFTGSDTYIELFEDLSKASVRSMDYMIDQLKVLKSSLSSLDPSNLKTIVDQIEKLEDELIKRDPFKVLSDSMKSWREFRKDEKTTSLINEILGTDGDIKASEFRKTLDKAIEEARKKVDDARENVNIMSAVFGAAKKRDSIISSGKLAEVEGLDWNKLYNIEELKNTLRLLENLEEEATKAANSEERSEEERTESQKRRTVLNEEIKTISEYISSLEEIKKHGFFDEDLDMSLQDIQQAWEDANGDLEQFVKNLRELENGKRHMDKIGEAAIEAGKQLADMATNMKNAYTSINEYLDSIGVATGEVGEAWKEFGNTMFDTIIQALQMIPAMVASIVSAETAINAAAGWIGLIAEAITLVMGLAKSLAGLHDAYKQEEIDRLQKSLDRLEKTANDLDEAFDDLFDEDRLRAFDAALIKTRELEIATLNAMIEAEKAKKKADQTVIDGYQEQIDSLYDDIQDGIDKFYESLGGFGSEANMKSMAESWTDAWYDAFKETGDGLQGLEDSFDEFIDNLYKKTILNKLSEKYFKDLYTQLDSILATEGGLTNNLDAFNDWIGLVQNAFDGFNEDATAAMNALSNVYGAGGGLEGLQASIQGMTEETADILAAYLNSVRFYVADNNQLLQNLYNVMAIDNDANPMLQQLKIIAAQTTAIHNVFDSVVSFGGDVSGNFVKVKISQ